MTETLQKRNELWDGPEYGLEYYDYDEEEVETEKTTDNVSQLDTIRENF